ncbi:trypsin-like serine proteases, typically periplasmic, contain C-terminal PDZ domain [Coriobacteriaceae bacterium EMTCatB1]|nr:trypsin-like serine proteases, typically periplasmic, contain C-terminal PDZ domain [Coriobacteriaceae bacterium EMTCatB1]
MEHDTPVASGDALEPETPIDVGAEPAQSLPDSSVEPPPASSPAPLLPPPPAAVEQPRVPWGRVLAVAALVAALFGLAGGYGGWLLARRAGVAPSAGTVRVVSGTTEEAVAAAAAAAVPSVVNIDVTTQETSDSGSGLPQDHPAVPVTGNGSGVAFKRTPEGGTYILTNQHVVAGADTIVVTDSTGERHKGTVVGEDEETDIAVVEVDAEIPLVKIGDSEKLVVGQLVVAIGSPFGLQHSVTAGVVSAIHRSLPDFAENAKRYPLVDVIQTDAAINPGNSGGALVDRTGALVGIPAAIFTDTGADNGVGFAIPVKTAVRVATEIIETGSAKHPFLGIEGMTVTPELAEEKKLPVEEGAYVVNVTKGTEAEKARLKPGDVIVKLDDTPIRSMDDLLLAVRRHAIGDTVTLTLWRGGEQMQVTMKVGVKPKDL